MRDIVCVRVCSRLLTIWWIRRRHVHNLQHLGKLHFNLFFIFVLKSVAALLWFIIVGAFWLLVKFVEIWVLIVMRLVWFVSICVFKLRLRFWWFWTQWFKFINDVRFRTLCNKYLTLRCFTFDLDVLNFFQRKMYWCWRWKIWWERDLLCIVDDYMFWRGRQIRFWRRCHHIWHSMVALFPININRYFNCCHHTWNNCLFPYLEEVSDFFSSKC